jgi:CRP/FNR family transcriptional regulator, anaerobic regulatory protein
MARTPCTECPLRKFELFTPFTRSELAFMLSFKVGELNLDRGATFLQEGMPSPQLYTFLDGFGLRYRTLENGERQVINFAMPGDLVGLQAAIMGEMAHSVESTTPVRLCVFNRSDLWRLFENHPERAYDLTWLSAVEEHFLGEALATLGRRTARQRIAWALGRVYMRLHAVGLADNKTVPMPWRQRDLADALGLSLVHTNKTLQLLRQDGVMQWAADRLYVPDLAELARRGALELEPQPRRPLI